MNNSHSFPYKEVFCSCDWTSRSEQPTETSKEQMKPVTEDDVNAIFGFVTHSGTPTGVQGDVGGPHPLSLTLPEKPN